MLLMIAEVGLVMLLFTDAGRIDRRMLTGNGDLPVRLLSIRMLPTILLGAVCAMLLFLFDLPVARAQFGLAVALYGLEPRGAKSMTKLGSRLPLGLLRIWHKVTVLGAWLGRSG